MRKTPKTRSSSRPSRAEAARRRQRVVAIVESLPGAAAVGDRHLSLEVRGKRFGWYLEDHHGDGRIALHVKAPPGALKAHLAAAPERFHSPAHVGHRGWVGLWLDLPATDWEEVTRVVTRAYSMAAPKRLGARLDSRGGVESAEDLALAMAPDAMAPDEFRALALSFPGAIEGKHMDHPDFRVGGKIFASLGPGEKWGMVKLTPQQQALAVREEPRIFAPFPGAWGRRGCTRVLLERASAAREAVRQALVAAWRNTAPKKMLREIAGW